MNITIGASILIIYGTFIVLYFLFNRKRGGHVYRAAYINSIVCYALCLAAFTLLPKTGGERGQNFIPFINFLKNGEDGRVFEFAHFLGYILNALLNMLLLLPLGVFIAVHCELNYVRRPFLAAILTGLGVSVCVGFLRFVLPVNRIVDIDCAIYYVLGAITGVSVFRRIRHRAFVRRYLKTLRLSADVDQILS